ncbi:MAG: cbb3-type cytochrome c oxidase subunit I [Rhodospirillales bacterium]|nr:cbb3-type cytochrome c oxidase subunit I [Rhodospirillales bacterium]
MASNYEYHKSLDWEAEDLLSKHTFMEIITSSDARLLGIKGMLLALIMLGVGGIMAMTMRAELMLPGIQFIGPKPYINAVTIHGLIMVLGYSVPFAVAALYFILPRTLGVDRIHSAWAAHMSFVTLLLGGVLLFISRPDFTWSFYAPLSIRVATDMIWMAHLAIIFVGLSEFLSGLPLIATAMAWKRGGADRRWMDMPLSGWAALTGGIFLVFSAPMLSLVGALLLTDYLQITAIYDPARGGDALTFLFMSWFYGHPAVYLPLVPLIGVLYHMLPRMLGRNLWSHTSGVIAFAALCALGFGVWVHHFQPNFTIHDLLNFFFQFMTMMILIPSSLHVFNWVASLWQGRISDETRAAVPFKFMMGAIFMIIVGGVNGYLNGQVAIDSDFIHNTYWLPAHFHAMFLGFIGMMSMATFYFFFPYITGRMFNQKLANLHFWLWLPGIFSQVMLMFWLGLTYHPRWVVDYLPLPEWVTGQFWLSVAGFVNGFGFLLFLINILISVRSGKKVTGDPWPVPDTTAASETVPEAAE